MRLRDLEAEFLRLTGKSDGSMQRLGDRRDGADGVQFLCPKCFKVNRGPVGTHSVICWFAHVPQAVSPKPGRWNPQGASIDDLTFVPPGAVSVLLTGGCGWHGLVVSGEATIQ